MFSTSSMRRQLLECPSVVVRGCIRGETNYVRGAPLCNPVPKPDALSRSSPMRAGAQEVSRAVANRSSKRAVRCARSWAATIAWVIK